MTGLHLGRNRGKRRGGPNGTTAGEQDSRKEIVQGRADIFGSPVGTVPACRLLRERPQKKKREQSSRTLNKYILGSILLGLTSTVKEKYALGEQVAEWFDFQRRFYFPCRKSIKSSLANPASRSNERRVPFGISRLCWGTTARRFDEG